MTPIASDRLIAGLLAIAMAACPYFCLGGSAAAGAATGCRAVSCLCGCHDDGPTNRPAPDDSTKGRADCLCRGALPGWHRSNGGTEGSVTAVPHATVLPSASLPKAAEGKSVRTESRRSVPISSGRTLCTALSVWRN